MARALGPGHPRAPAQEKEARPAAMILLQMDWLELRFAEIQGRGIPKSWLGA